MDRQAIEDECQLLRNAMKGIGTDEKSLTNITLKYTSEQRLNIRLSYKTCFGRDLLEDLGKELSGHYKEIMIGLYEDPFEYDAKCLYKAMKGLGTNEDTLIEIICTRNNQDLKKVCEAFKKLYSKELTTWVESETSHSFKKFLVSLLTCNRSENTNPDQEKMKELAHQLYVGGEAKAGTDEQIFNRVFATASKEELLCIAKWYENLTGNTKNLRNAVDKEFSGDIKKALLTVYDYFVSPAEYYAKRINYAVKGLGTNDTILVRVLVSQESKMKEIREAYTKVFNKDMVKDIEGDTSGNYKIAASGIASK